MLAVTSAQEFPAAPSAGLTNLVLLKNGNVLTGWVQANFDKTVIETPSGSELIIATSEIALICETHREAFEYLRSRISPEDHSAQQQLFQWCLRYEQWDLAQHLIDRWQFTKFPPGQLDVLNRQLQGLVAVAEQRRQTNSRSTASGRPLPAGELVAANPPLASAMSSPASSSPASLPPNPVTNDPAVRPVNFESPTSSGSSNPGGGRLIAAPNAIQLERQLKQLPELGLSSYKRLIEPALVKNCASAGCHSKAAEVLPLYTVGKGLAIPKRMSQQNLYQVLHWIDPQNFDESRLLKAAGTAHGGAEQPPLGLDSSDFQILRDWVIVVQPAVNKLGLPSPEMSPGSRDANSSPPDASDSRSRLPSMLPFRERFERPAAAVSSSPTLPGESLADKNQLDDRRTAEAPLPSIPHLGNPVRDKTSRDPFDPEKFNRLFVK